MCHSSKLKARAVPAFESFKTTLGADMECVRRRASFDIMYICLSCHKDFSCFLSLSSQIGGASKLHDRHTEIR